MSRPYETPLRAHAALGWDIGRRDSLPGLVQRAHATLDRAAEGQQIERQDINRALVLTGDLSEFTGCEIRLASTVGARS